MLHFVQHDKEWYRYIDGSHMPLYNVGNLVLSSNIALPGLAEIDHGLPHYTFQLQAERVQDPGSFDWFHHWHGTGEEIWTSFARYQSGYLLRFPDLADFELVADTAQIDCYPTPETPIDTIAHLLLDQVFPVVLGRSGRLVVHASAVATPAGAIAFVGSSGRGKSTLAASFALQGLPLMTDDCLLLDESDAGLTATPSYPGARLWDDSIETLFEHEPLVSDVAHYTDKKRLALNNGQVHFFGDRVELRRMYFLDDPEEAVDQEVIEIIPLAAREAFMELVAYSFKLEIDERDVLEREFRMLNRISTLPLFYRLSYPRNYDILPAVHAAILSHIHE